MKGFIRYSGTVEINNDMIKDCCFIDEIKLDCELKCFKEAIKHSKSEFRIHERLFLDTTKEPDEKLFSDNNMLDFYFFLKRRNISRYIFTILAK